MTFFSQFQDWTRKTALNPSSTCSPNLATFPTRLPSKGEFCFYFFLFSYLVCFFFPLKKVIDITDCYGGVAAAVSFRKNVEKSSKG